MIVTAHVIAGGIVAEELGDPIIGFIVAFFLHFVMDALPHFDTTDGGKWTKKQILFTSSDFLLSAILILFFVQPVLSFSNLFLWGAFGSFLPDLIDNPPMWSGWIRKTKYGKKFHAFHEWCHAKVQPSFWFGVTTQLGLVAILLFMRNKS
ncbi:MAG TPA: hypothetical protein PK263_03610 [bacterium]|nr:hypothetical protein [bacterium]